MKKKLISLSDRHVEMIEQIMEHAGWTSPTEVIRRGLEEVYFKYFPTYRPSPIGKATTEESLLDKALLKQKVKELTEKAKVEDKLAEKEQLVIKQLGGEIYEKPDGKKMCRWTMYTLHGDSEQSVPLAYVNETMVRTSLFVPDRETIFKNRKDVKKKFDALI